MSNTTKAKAPAKLKAGDWSISEQPRFVNLGFDLLGRTTIGWDLDKSKNLLIAGYGVRPTEWAISAIVRHFKEHSVAVYGQDFSSFVSGFPKGTFESFTTERSAAEEMVEKLAESDHEHVLLIAAADHLLAPTYLSEAEREVEEARYQRVVAALLRELDNPKAHVVITTSRLNEVKPLPNELLAKFSTYLLSSKIFARDQEHVLREDQDAKAIEKAIKDMSATHSLMLDAGERVREFESFHVPVK